MYLEFWGLKEKPFENTPDPRFFYATPRHEEALTRMLYAVSEQKGAAMLSGEYGSGKTLLTRIVTNQLLGENDRYKIAIIINPNIPADELLEEILYQLGKSVAPGARRKSECIRQLNAALYENANAGSHTVIIIDEAQAIKDESTFEELRLLLNFQLNNRFLLTLLLFGQPELREKIGNVKQLEQRLAVRFHLSHLTEEETRNYVRYRCKVAGAEKELFSDEAHRMIYRGSEGIPRVINNICDMALVAGMGGSDPVSGPIIQNVVKDLCGIEVK
ncbi:MAG: AAA family ATPase [Candidatus Brocadiia bacterium]